MSIYDVLAADFGRGAAGLRVRVPSAIERGCSKSILVCLCLVDRNMYVDTPNRMFLSWKFVHGKLLEMEILKSIYL